MRRGDLAEARRRVDRAIDLNPGLVVVHGLNAVIPARDGHLLESLRALNEALRLNPTRHNWSTWNSLGLVKMVLGRGQEAAEIWERLRASNPDLIGSRINLAVHYEEEGRHEEAMAVAREILRINPDFHLLTTDPAVEAAYPDIAARYRENLRRVGIP